MRHIHKPLATASLIFLLATGSAAFAQQAPPPPLAADPAMASAATATVATGRIQRLLVNPGGDVDGLLLADGTQVAFAPQPAGRLALKVGETVEVNGWRTPVAQVVRASGITAGQGGAQRLAAPMRGRDAAPPPEPSAMAPLVAMNTSGNVARLLYTDRGDTNGVLLDNGTVVRFPPHIGAALQDTLQPGRPLFARGWGSRSAAGNAIEANAMGSSADRMQDVLAAGGPPARPPRPGADRPRGPRGPIDRMPPPPPAGDMPPAPPAP